MRLNGEQMKNFQLRLSSFSDVAPEKKKTVISNGSPLEFKREQCLKHCSACSRSKVKAFYHIIPTKSNYLSNATHIKLTLCLYRMT